MEHGVAETMVTIDPVSNPHPPRPLPAGGRLLQLNLDANQVSLFKQLAHRITASSILKVGFGLLALAGRQAAQSLQPVGLPPPCPHLRSQPETPRLNANSTNNTWLSPPSSRRGIRTLTVALGMRQLLGRD